MKKFSVYLFVILCFLIGLYPFSYFIQEDQSGILLSKSAELLASHIWQIAFYSHICFGGFALLIGWLQFNRKLRTANPKIHRIIGIAYVIFALVSGLCGFYLAFYATGGIIPSLGFGSLALLWLYTTSKAYLFAINGNFKSHENLMIYSFSACFAAVTLRIWLPLLIFISGDFMVAYKIVAWLCWLPNVGFAYWLTRSESAVQELN